MKCTHVPCRYCGNDPDVPEDHKAGCPTIGTCAQCAPNQVDIEDAHTDDWWLDGLPFTTERLREHLAKDHDMILKVDS